MDLLVKTAFYASAGVSALGVAVLLLINLVDPPPGRDGRAYKVVALVAGGAGFGLLAAGFYVAHQHDRWYAGFALAFAALAVAGGVSFMGQRMIGRGAQP